LNLNLKIKNARTASAPLARPKRLPVALAALLLAAVIALTTFEVAAYAFDPARSGRQGPLTDPTDFVGFYCGGAVLAERRDPYRADSLRTCERRALAASHIAIVPNLVVPAPLPPYALAVFALISAVPFRVACAGFFVLSLVAIGSSIVLALRLAKISVGIVGLSLGVALGLGSLTLGQIIPFAVVALCGCALALRTGRFRLAALAALAMMVEPNVGLATVLGLFVLERRTRPVLALGLLAAGCVSLAAGGPALNVEYLTQVLPAHARSEVGNFAAQYSLTALTYALGAGVRTALVLGEASYLVMLALGIEFARRLTARFGDRAFVALAPAACILIGGVYVHDHQMALALPCGFVLAQYAPRMRPLAYVSLLVLAVPWESVLRVALLPLVPSPVPFAPGPSLATVGAGSILADTVWQTWVGVAGRDGRTPLEIFAIKLPTWLAFFTLGIVAFKILGGKRSSPGVQTPDSALRSEIRR